MTCRWQLRKAYFHGPGTYKVGAPDSTIEVRVDKNGIFELEKPVDFPLGIFAKVVDE